jgi:hypothetical protein
MDEFKKFRVLIVDPSVYSKNPLRCILTALGGARIEMLTSTDEALSLLRMKFFHHVLCAAPVWGKPEDPVSDT